MDTLKVGDWVTIVKGHNSVKNRPAPITAISGNTATLQLGGRTVTAPLSSLAPAAGPHPLSRPTPTSTAPIAPTPSASPSAVPTSTLAPTSAAPGPTPKVDTTKRFGAAQLKALLRKLGYGPDDYSLDNDRFHGWTLSPTVSGKMISEQDHYAKWAAIANRMVGQLRAAGVDVRVDKQSFGGPRITINFR
jgi:hypothetical protein